MNENELITISNKILLEHVTLMIREEINIIGREGDEKRDDQKVREIPLYKLAPQKLYWSNELSVDCLA